MLLRLVAVLAICCALAAATSWPGRSRTRERGSLVPERALGERIDAFDLAPSGREIAAIDERRALRRWELGAAGPSRLVALDVYEARYADGFLVFHGCCEEVGQLSRLEADDTVATLPARHPLARRVGASMGSPFSAYHDYDRGSAPTPEVRLPRPALTLSGTERGTLVVRQTRAPTAVTETPMQRGAIRSLVLAGAWIVTGGDDGVLRSWCFDP